MQKFTCTSCSYLYNPFLGEEGILPGTAFEDLDESWTCPHCGDDKEVFIETPENIQEVSPYTQSEEETSHIPFYREQWEKIVIQIGTMDNPHEIEENHFIEYVGIFDMDGDVLDIRIQPEESILVFENPWTDEYEVRLSCNIHGVWRGIEVRK